ncbi:FAD-binding oxidoreductase [Streptomyces sp. NPDC050759]|uniref:FAD-binding oxidoreductase n=1 Tax=Streptomyces sp. NPDC050759 TaxID=3365635 RepID=UPI0037BB9171
MAGILDGTTVPNASEFPHGHRAPAPPARVAVTPEDPRYDYLGARGLNRRLSSRPEVIHQVFTARQVEQAVAESVAAGRRIAVRSGGHCLESLVDRPDVTSLIDVSRLNSVYYDPEHAAFSVDSGAQLGDVYKQLYLGHGVVIPGGTCPTVGVAGYTQGGGFGALCREQGLIVDHLHGVEVVVVDGAGRARTVVATREPGDPHRDLWWGHTGAGGGNFGVVTRFLFRSPHARGNDPARALPKPPGRSLVATVRWSWEGMTEADFTRLVGNHGAWHAEHSADGSPYAGLYTSLVLSSRSVGTLSLVAETDGTAPNAAALMDGYLDAVNAGVRAPRTVGLRTMPWITAVYSDLFGSVSLTDNRYKGKGAYLRRPYTADQVAVMYRHLTDPSFTGRGAVNLLSYGGRVNAVDPGATAVAQRDSVLKAYTGAAWADPARDEEHMDWVRGIYRDMHAATGGVPVPDGATDGSYINYPDTDLADPAWNTSGVPWHTLYFKDNYPRLQRVKAAYDPGDVFRHPLSVRLPD